MPIACYSNMDGVGAERERPTDRALPYDIGVVEIDCLHEVAINGHLGDPSIPRLSIPVGDPVPDKGKHKRIVGSVGPTVRTIERSLPT